MKILQINCVYGNGSTGKLVEVLHKYYTSNAVDSVVLYGRGKKVVSPNVIRVGSEYYSLFQHLKSKISGIMYGGCYFSTAQVISQIKKEKPDIVHLHCINGYFVNIYRLVTWLRVNNIKTVLTLHAEFMYTGGCGYSLECRSWANEFGCSKCPRFTDEIDSLFFDRTGSMFQKMKKAFRGFDNNLIVTSVSPWLMTRAKQSIILGKKTNVTVMNGIDEDIFFYDSDKIEKYNSIRKAYAPNGEKILLHVTPWFDTESSNIKGSRYILDIAEKIRDGSITILVAGKYSPNIQVPSNIVLLGNISDQYELSILYSSADTTIITSQKETFSMVTAESLCCGTPIVGFQAGGPESIAQQEYSKFVSYGNVDDLYKAIIDTLNSNYNKLEISENSIKRFSQTNMAKGYLSVYKELIDSNVE